MGRVAEAQLLGHLPGAGPRAEAIASAFESATPEVARRRLAELACEVALERGHAPVAQLGQLGYGQVTLAVFSDEVGEFGAWVRDVEELGRYDRPFLTAFTTGDPYFSGLDTVLQAHVPGAEGQYHARFEGVHFLQEDLSPELAGVIVDFLTRMRAADEEEARAARPAPLVPPSHGHPPRRIVAEAHPPGGHPPRGQRRYGRP